MNPTDVGCWLALKLLSSHVESRFFQSKGILLATVSSVLVVDDHPLVARGIADFLQTHCGFTSVISVSDISDLCELWVDIQHAALSMVVVDFWLPDGASLPLLQALRAQHPYTPQLVVSDDYNADIESKVRAVGANGFLHQQEAPAVFVQAIAEIKNGGTWFRGMTHLVARTTRALPITVEAFGLTARQGEVLAMMLKGLPNKRIAMALSVSEQTVKDHVSGILNKLGVNNRIEAITKLGGRRYGNPPINQ